MYWYSIVIGIGGVISCVPSISCFCVAGTGCGGGVAVVLHGGEACINAYVHTWYSGMEGAGCKNISRPALKSISGI